MSDKMRQAAITIYEFLREVRYEVYMSILAFAPKKLFVEALFEMI